MDQHPAEQHFKKVKLDYLQGILSSKALLFLSSHQIY